MERKGWFQVLSQIPLYDSKLHMGFLSEAAAKGELPLLAGYISGLW